MDNESLLQVEEQLQRISERAKKGIRMIGEYTFAMQTGLPQPVVDQALSQPDEDGHGGLQGLSLGDVERIRIRLGQRAEEFYK